MRTLLFLTLTFVVSPAAQARDWFVRAGESGGDGTLNKPFADPWQALEKCEAGDTIHVAVGKYYGRNRVGKWEVPFDDITLLGGYDREFKQRNPWKYPSELLWDKDSKNWPNDVRFKSNQKNTTFDGFAIDQQDQCKYTDPKKTGRTEKPCDSPLRFSQPATIRNNVIINPGLDGISATQGSTIENNLILNAVNWGIVVNFHKAYERQISTIKNNTILFSWDFRAPGKGGYAGSGIAVKSHANITDNILAFMDNNGVYMTYEAERTSITNNVFFMNKWANVKLLLGGASETVADDQSMDLLEEMDFKSADGNEVKNPGLAIDPKWYDSVSRRTVGSLGKVEMDDFNKARQLLGLPLVAKGGTSPSGVAPAYPSVAVALKLMTPKVKQGAHIVSLPVKYSTTVAAGPSRDYQPTTVDALAANPSTNKPISVVVAVDNVTNNGGIPPSFDKKTHEAMRLYDPNGSGKWIIGFYRKGSAAQRALQAQAGWYRGQGKADRTLTLKGVSYEIRGSIKGGLLVESADEGAAQAPAQAEERPAGRDWFVRAGAKGGNGTKEKPFRDPWQALEKVESGDTIHVAGGEYNGKLRKGHWVIPTSYIALLGGYDQGFKTRNPWKHPTLLTVSDKLKTYNSHYTIEGENDHTGAIVDGFVFDRKSTNKYKANGDLDYDNSIKMQHIWLARPGCIVRNNVFVNGPEHAVRLAGGQTIENNIFVNHRDYAVRIEVGFGGLVTIRNNTFAFAWDPIRFGKGNTSGGSLLSVGGRVEAVIDNNIFAFADNHGITLGANPKDVVLTNNVFSHNLYSHVRSTTNNGTVADDRTWATLADFGFKKQENNQLLTAGLPLDRAWFDVYLNRVAYTPGKVQMDDWNQLRSLLGQPVIATGGKAGSGFMPLFAWKDAVKLFPKNRKVKAGARAKDLPVAFTGIERAGDPERDYVEIDWSAAKSADAWSKYVGQPVAIKIVIKNEDNNYRLGDIKKAKYQAFQFWGQEGDAAGGLPMYGYVKKGTRHEKLLKKAKNYRSGTPEQTYLVKGIARENRNLVVDTLERLD